MTSDEPLLQETITVGRVGDRLKRLVKRIVKARPLQKLAKGFAKLAKSPIIRTIAGFIPGAGPILQGASAAANVVANLRAGNPNARETVQRLAAVAESNLPEASRARAALRMTSEIAQGRVPEQVERVVNGAMAARSFASRLASGDPNAQQQARALRSAALRGDAPARRALRASQVAFRALTDGQAATSGDAHNIATGASILWGVTPYRIGIRPQSEVYSARTDLKAGADILASAARQRYETEH